MNKIDFYHRILFRILSIRNAFSPSVKAKRKAKMPVKRVPKTRTNSNLGMPAENNRQRMNVDRRESMKTGNKRRITSLIYNCMGKPSCFQLKSTLRVSMMRYTPIKEKYSVYEGIPNRYSSHVRGKTKAEITETIR